ncbi:MAG: hypothetical protein AB7H86_18210 [Blastocatellales bacterium]
MKSVTRKNIIMPVLMLFGLMFAIGTIRANAQVMDPIDADIPFQFHAGNAKLPAGKYMVRMLDGADQTVMEIASIDGHHSSVFQIRNTIANVEPKKTELIFNRYGDQYFLSQIFEEGYKTGNELLESHYERLAKKNGAKAMKHHIPGFHRHMAGKK